MMGLAAVSFHWTPAEFRSSTPHEFFAAYEALRDMHKKED